MRTLLAVACGLLCAAGAGAAQKKGGPVKATEVAIARPTHPIAALERALEAPAAADRAAAASELAGADKLSRSTLQRLLDLSRTDPDPAVRVAAAWTFGHLALSSPGGEKMAEGQVDTQPRLLSQPRLAYPPAAYAARVEGTLKVEIVIDETGHVARAEVRESIPALDQAALDSVRGWTFAPGLKDGKPVPVTALVPVTFKL